MVFNTWLKKTDDEPTGLTLIRTTKDSAYQESSVCSRATKKFKGLHFQAAPLLEDILSI